MKLKANAARHLTFKFAAGMGWDVPGPSGQSKEFNAHWK